MAAPQLPAPADLTLAQKIDRLFVTMHPVDRGEFTYREVADGIKAILAERGERDGSLSASYICQLRKGRRTNPTLRQVEMLAAFFKVPVTYFVGTPGEVESIDAQMTLVRALRDQGVRDIALRASALTPAGLNAVAEMITTLQGLPGMTRRKPGPAPRDAGRADALHCADPHCADSHSADPHRADSHRADSHCADPHCADSHSADPRRADPRRATARRADPRRAEFRRPGARYPEPRQAEPRPGPVTRPPAGPADGEDSP